MRHSSVSVSAAARRRLPLVDNSMMAALLTGAAVGLPPINVFRALANAPSLSPDYMQYFAHPFKPLELDARIERLLVLLIGKLSGCEYFSSRALTEILYVVGSYMFLSRVVRTGRIPLDEKPAEVPHGFFG